MTALILAPNHWRRTLWAMLSVQFIVSGAFSIVPPIIPLVLPALGVHDAAAVRTWAGALVGVTPLAAALMSPRWGRLADRIDRRLIILISCTAAALCTASMSLATSPWQLLALRFTMGLFGGHVAASLAIVSGAAPTNRLGWALGILVTAQMAGTLLGPLLGGFIADAFGSFRAPFLLGGAAALFIGAAVGFVPASRKRDLSAVQEVDRTIHSRQGNVGALVVVLLMTQCAIMMTQPIISLHVRELVGDRSDIATLAGLAFSVVALSGLLAAPLLGMGGDWVGTRRLLFLIVIAAIACVTPQAYAPTYGWFVSERFLAGLFLCGVIPIVNSLVGRSVPEQDRGRAFGLTSGASFLGAFIGPVSGGLIGAQFGLRAVFLTSGLVLLVNAVWIGVYVWPGKR
jgi:MFS transporter, DHA1 family, multidrug resistance protein